MHRIKFGALSALLTLISFQIKAQHIHKCGTYEFDQGSHIKFSRSKDALSEANFKTLQMTNKIIPVVFHVIYDPRIGDASNITKTQIEDAVRIMNEDYNKLNSDTSQVISAFTGIMGKPNIEFRLAKIDPNGNCTEGITRTASPLTNVARNNVKSLIVWPTSQYLNVWVVKNITSTSGGTTLGFATKPSSSGTQGIVVLNRALGSIGTANTDARTMTHEAGHYFNLDHPWVQPTIRD